MSWATPTGAPSSTRSGACTASGPSHWPTSIIGWRGTVSSGRHVSMVSRTTWTTGGRCVRPNARPGRRPGCPAPPARPPRSAVGRVAGDHRARSVARMVPFGGGGRGWTVAGRGRAHVPCPARGHRSDADRRRRAGQRANAPGLQLGRGAPWIRAVGARPWDATGAHRRTSAEDRRPQGLRLGRTSGATRRRAARVGCMATPLRSPVSRCSRRSSVPGRANRPATGATELARVAAAGMASATPRPATSRN
jgi:hypothetical protein